MEDKRETLRARLDVYLNQFIDGTPYMARSSNISNQGLSFAHLLEPAIEKKSIGLQFQLPGSDEIIYAEGHVIRKWGTDGVEATTEVNGSAVRFTLLTERHRKLIHAFVAHAP